MSKKAARAKTDHGMGELTDDIIEAARAGSATRVRNILAIDPEEIHARDRINGFTPLHYACFHGSLELLQLLLEQPTVDVLAPDFRGAWPIHYAYSGPDDLLNLIDAYTFPDSDNPEYDWDDEADQITPIKPRRR